MKTYPVKTNNQQTFTALSMPSKKKIAKTLGLRAASQMDEAIPVLKEIGKRNDIKLLIIEDGDFHSRGFKITVSDVIKNPFKNKKI